MLVSQIQQATEQQKNDLLQTAKALQEVAGALRAEADQIDKVVEFLVGPQATKSPTAYPAMPRGNGQVFAGGVGVEVEELRK